MGNSRYCLTKADLADGIYATLPVDKQKAAQIVEDYIEIIKDALEKDGKVMLSGFGAYEVRHKPQRRGRNPQTGETITLRERNVVKFKPSMLLRKAINSHNASVGQSAGDETEADDLE
jgi:integration host factor subunit alpha